MEFHLSFLYFCCQRHQILFCVFWVTSTDAQGLSLALPRELLRAMLRGLYVMLGIEPKSAVRKVNTLPTVLSIRSQHQILEDA